jgi:hypothetical protein
MTIKLGINYKKFKADTSKTWRRQIVPLPVRIEKTVLADALPD